jgi:hypothetical protein
MKLHLVLLFLYVFLLLNQLNQIHHLLVKVRHFENLINHYRQLKDITLNF